MVEDSAKFAPHEKVILIGSTGKVHEIAHAEWCQFGGKINYLLMDGTMVPEAQLKHARVYKRKQLKI